MGFFLKPAITIKMVHSEEKKKKSNNKEASAKETLLWGAEKECE